MARVSNKAICDERYKEFKQHIDTIDKYKKDRINIHNKNSEVMREFSRDNIQLSKKNTELAEKVAKLNSEINSVKTDHAVDRATVAMLEKFTEKMDSLITKLAYDINAITKTLAMQAGGRGMLREVVVYTVKLTAFTATVIGIITYLGGQ